MSTVATATALKFHLSLNVSDLTRAINFYRVLFDQEPAKWHDDYAKFEIEDPPVIFSLVPRKPGPGGSLSHVGLRVANPQLIDTYRSRLEAAGLSTECQEGTVCGYARQNKVWVKDPDGTFWEIYHVEEDVLPETVRTSLAGPSACREEPVEPVVWEHYVTEPVPERVPHDDASLDEVRLTGTFNAGLSATILRTILGESFRVLKPGGKVVTHGLMADRAFPGPQPKLPGLAAMVASIPVDSEPAAYFRAAGFVGLQIAKFTDRAWFVHDGVEMREVKILAWKPETQEAGEMRQVLYKGPFREACVDGGHVFPRGQRVTVPLNVWNQLRLGASADHFVFLDVADKAGCLSS